MEVLDAVPAPKSEEFQAMASTLRAMTASQLGKNQDAAKHLEQARELNKTLALRNETNVLDHWQNVPICELFLAEAEALINDQ